MHNEKLFRFHRIYSTLMSIAIGIVGICFIIACGCIYYSGDTREQVYTVDIISKAFRHIAFPVYLCLAMLVTSFVIDFFAPYQFRNGKLDKPYAHILKRLYTTKDLDECEESCRHSLASLQKTRQRHIIIRSVLITGCSIGFLSYALNGSNFDSSDINGSMIKAVWILCIFMLIPFVFSIISSYECRATMRLEIEILKTLPTKTSVKDFVQAENTRPLQITQIILLVIGLGFVIFGLLSNGTADVLTKAINICTECIGLG